MIFFESVLNRRTDAIKKKASNIISEENVWKVQASEFAPMYERVLKISKVLVNLWRSTFEFNQDEFWFSYRYQPGFTRTFINLR